MRVCRTRMFVILNTLKEQVSVSLTHARVPAYVRPGIEITKDLRRQILGVENVSGAMSMKCEEYQRRAIEDGTGVVCTKSNNMRINMERGIMDNKSKPYNEPGGFEWTEDFDGIQRFNDTKFYINLKWVVEAGGSQTRTLKLVYEFIKGQMLVINNLGVGEDVYFVNILDGEICATNMHHFEYLFSRFGHGEHIRSRIYVGDLFGYFEWLNNKLETIL